MRLWDHKALGLTALIFWMGILPCAWADNFWEAHATGWHWYEIPAQTHSRQADNDATSDPIQIMEALHQQVKRALDQAILNPTPDNMQHYIALQNQVSAQASRFAIAWQAALLNKPVLDFSLSHPTNTIGKQVYLNEQKKDEPSPTILKKYINFQKYERLETIKEGLKIRIDLLHFDGLKVGGASISKANYFQFNAKSLYVDIPPTKELPRFFIYGQSASIVSLFSHFRRFNDFAQVSVYGTTMSNGSDPIVLADYIFFSSPFGATFDDIILKCENKDIDIRDFIK